MPPKNSLILRRRAAPPRRTQDGRAAHRFANSFTSSEAGRRGSAAPTEAHRARLPAFPLPRPALAPRAVRRGRPPALQGFRPGHLLPPGIGVEFLRVAAAQHLKRRVGVALEVDL